MLKFAGIIFHLSAFMSIARIIKTCLLAVIILWLPVSVRGDGTIDNERARYEAITAMTNRQLYDRGTQYRESDPDSALLYYDVLANRYKPTMPSEDARMCAEAMLNSGKIFYEHFNYSSAMESLLRCRKLCENNGFTDMLSDTYRFIGNIFSIHSDFERAVVFYDKALSIATSLGDKVECHQALNNLIGAYVFLDNAEKADEYYRRMRSCKCDYNTYHYDVTVAGGLIAMRKGDTETALRLLTEAAEYAGDNSLDVSKRGVPNSWLANIYMSTGDSDRAIHYLLINENLARQARQNDLLVETLRALTFIHRERGEHDKSVKYLEEYLSLSDSVFNQKVFNSLKNTQFQWELDKSEGMIRDLNEERLRQEIHIGQQRTILWAVTIGLLILTGLLIIIYRQKRHISAAYTDLFERNRASLEKEKADRMRIRELQLQIEAASRESQPAGEPHAPAPEPTENATTQLDITPELRQRLERDIASAMDRTELFCDPTFTINRLAEEVGSNTTYISRIINETYGMNFRAFLSEYRIKESMTRMGNNGPYANFTIKAIAESVGFKSQSAFIAAFTKFTGMKPSMYQEIAKKQF